MEDKLQSILAQSFEVFLRYGFKSVTMDDVAKNLRISKKTLYKHVKDKNDLVYKVMDFGRGMEMCMIDEIRDKKLNAIDENFEISKFVLDKLNNIHPSIFFDLEKYYPEAWAIMVDHRENYVMTCVLKNLEQGIKEGWYREDIDAMIIARLHSTMMDVLFHPEQVPGHRFKEIYIEMFRYHIRGIASDKGRKYLVEKMKKEQTNL
jgi:AcrR family transcriptional regulator